MPRVCPPRRLRSTYGAVQPWAAMICFRNDAHAESRDAAVWAGSVRSTRGFASPTGPRTETGTRPETRSGELKPMTGQKIPQSAQQPINNPENLPRRTAASRMSPASVNNRVSAASPAQASAADWGNIRGTQRPRRSSTWRSPASLPTTPCLDSRRERRQRMSTMLSVRALLIPAAWLLLLLRAVADAAPETTWKRSADTAGIQAAACAGQEGQAGR